MMQQTKKLLALFVVLVLTANVKAQYFEENGIVYGITSEQTVEVQPYYVLLNSPYSGAVVIPQMVEHGGATYTVTALGYRAFESCTGVTTLTLPATIHSIGSYCFYNCNLTSLQLPDSLRILGDHAFLYSRVSTLHLPAHFEAYGEGTFWARSLTSITVDEGNPRYRSIDGWLFSKDSMTLCIVPDGVAGVINVPSYVRHIGQQAFGFNSRVTSILLPEGLTSIGDFAFNCCSVVNNIVIPSTVTRIGLCPFSYCPQLTNLTIASGNTHYVMDGLMLYSIGYDTLVSCHRSGANVTLNPNVSVLGGFENNTWVRNIDFPAGVTDILDNCFNGCAFTSMVLPAHLESIGTLAFATNSHLTSVTLPASFLSMGEGVFRDDILDNIRFAVATPPAVTGEGPLYGVGSLDSIVIPCGSLDAWRSDSYWGQFADKYVEDCAIGIADPEEENFRVYSLGGCVIVEGAEGEAVRVFNIDGRLVATERCNGMLTIPLLGNAVYIVLVGRQPAKKIVVKR